MTIRQRITFLIVLTFLALGFIGIFAVMQSRGSASEVRTVTEGVVPSAMASMELMTQLKDVQIAAMSMVAAPDPATVETTRAELAARKATLQKALQSQMEQADSPAQRGLVKEAEESLSNYFASIDDTANFKLAGQTAMAEANLAATVEQYLREQGSIIETLQIEKRRSKDAAIAHMNASLGNTAQTLALVTGLAVVALTAIGIFLYRQITRPISDMEAKMTEIATSQDFTHRVPVQRMDEIGRSLVAFNTMIEKIQESSALVKQKTADIQALLHYIPQGILTVTAGNRVHPEYSSYLETILETPDIAGRDLMELLFDNTSLGADTLAQVEAALGACIGEDAMNFDFNAHLLVPEIEITMPDGPVKVLDVRWSPMTDETGTVARIMVCVRDITELRALAAAAQAQKQELAMIGEILAVNQEKFHAFLSGAEQFVAENHARIAQQPEPTNAAERAEVLSQLFRNMHTIKGNARTYGLLHLTHVVHDAEQSYDTLRQDATQPWDTVRLLEELAQVSASLQAYGSIHEHKLGRKGPGRRGDVEHFLMVRKEQVQHTLALLDILDGADTEERDAALRQVRNSLQSMGTLPLEDVLSGVLESLPSLAQELGKTAPLTRIASQGVAVRTQIADVLKNVFTHLYRNAMDHGIESPQQRAALGKPLAGQITLDVALSGDRLQLTLRDDGRGLALGRIRDKALALGLLDDGAEASPEQLADMVFAPGFSTASSVTEVSGRGVGMEAVRGFIEREGGSIQLQLEPADAATEFCAFQTVITLPARYAVQATALAV